MTGVHQQNEIRTFKTKQSTFGKLHRSVTNTAQRAINDAKYKKSERNISKKFRNSIVIRLLKIIRRWQISTIETFSDKL